MCALKTRQRLGLLLTLHKIGAIPGLQKTRGLKEARYPPVTTRVSGGVGIRAQVSLFQFYGFPSHVLLSWGLWCDGASLSPEWGSFVTSSSRIGEKAVPGLVLYVRKEGKEEQVNELFALKADNRLWGGRIWNINDLKQDYSQHLHACCFYFSLWWTKIRRGPMPLFFLFLLAFRNGYPCLRAFVYSRLLPRASRGRVEGEEVMVSSKKAIVGPK